MLFCHFCNLLKSKRPQYFTLLYCRFVILAHYWEVNEQVTTTNKWLCRFAMLWKMWQNKIKIWQIELKKATKRMNDKMKVYSFKLPFCRMRQNKQTTNRILMCRSVLIAHFLCLLFSVDSVDIALRMIESNTSTVCYGADDSKESYRVGVALINRIRIPDVSSGTT